jgi:uncharacterized membrane protein YhdT
LSGTFMVFCIFLQARGIASFNVLYLEISHLMLYLVSSCVGDRNKPLSFTMSCMILIPLSCQSDHKHD